MELGNIKKGERGSRHKLGAQKDFNTALQERTCKKEEKYNLLDLYISRCSLAYSDVGRM